MILQQLVNGLLLGSSYALVGVAFTLIMGIFDLLNIALGEVFMLGAFFGLTFLALGLPFLPALALSIVAAGLVSLVIERLAFRPLRRAPPLVPLLSSIGFSILLQDVATNVWGSERIRFPEVLGQGSVSLGPVLLSTVQVVVLGTAVALMLGLEFFIRRTRVGRAMRAVAENPEAASLLGVEPDRVILVTFFVSGALAGAAGMLIALNFSLVDPYIGLQIGLKGVAAMVVGGAGNVYGAMLAGPLLGMAEVLSVSQWGASFRDVAVYGLLIVVLLVRPGGLLGTVQQGRV